MAQNFGAEVVLLVAKNADIAWQKAVYFHKPKRDKAVEPSVGNFLHNGVKAVLRYAFDKGCALRFLCRRIDSAADGGGVGVAETAFGDSVLFRLLAHARDKFAPRPYCKFGDCVFVHLKILFDVYAVGVFKKRFERGANAFNICVYFGFACKARCRECGGLGG